MRKNLGYCIVIVLVVFTVGASSTSFGQTDTGPALVMSNRSAELTQGSFANKGSLVLFLSWLEESRRARVSLEVNNVLLEATYDAGTDTLHWNGYNAALTPEDKEALVAFSRELEQSLGAATIFAERDMPLHERLLYERVLYWAEAPVGLPLTARTLRMPPIRQGVKRAVSIDDVEAAVCQRSGEDGVLRFPDCSTQERQIEHDATSHCYLSERIRSGPGSNDCLGRCGPSCGCGWSSYTYDCADHDRCCRVHGSCLNPRDASCGDEYREADDDFLRPLSGRLCFACRL